MSLRNKPDHGDVFDLGLSVTAIHVSFVTRSNDCIVRETFDRRNLVLPPATQLIN